MVYEKNVIALLRQERRKIVSARENCEDNFENRGFAATSRERSATNGCEERLTNASRRGWRKERKEY